MPLVVAQIGKSFRNEISPKGGLIRQREFLMAEIEHFLHPNDKFKGFEKFSQVENLKISLFSALSQKESKNSLKISLKEAVQRVICFYIYLIIVL